MTVSELLGRLRKGLYNFQGFKILREGYQNAVIRLRVPFHSAPFLVPTEDNQIGIPKAWAETKTSITLDFIQTYFEKNKSRIFSSLIEFMLLLVSSFVMLVWSLIYRVSNISVENITASTSFFFHLWTKIGEKWRNSYSI